MSKSLGQNIIKNIIGKYSQKRLVHTKKSAKGALETASKRAIQKTPETKSQEVHRRIIQRQLKVKQKI